MLLRWFRRFSPPFAVLLALSCFLWSGRAEDARWGKRPPQYYQALDAAAMAGTGRVLGVAHDAGDCANTTQLALAHGADVLEINVIAHEGRLLAAHNAPPSWLPTSAYRGPSLAEAWDRARDARFVELDLKDASPGVVRQLIAFLDTHQDGRRVFVATRNLTALATFHAERPELVRLYSIGDRVALQWLLDGETPLDDLNGVTVRATLLDVDTIARLKARGLLVFAWTVNDERLLNDLVAGGVDAITTDNLAILDALARARDRRDAVDLSRLIP